jgi:hypothetical protein
MFFLATADPQGQPNCSYKAGARGFVRVADDRTIAFPIYDGNDMYLSAGNAQVNPQVGLLFIDFEQQKRLRLNGLARIAPGDDLLAMYPEAQFVVRVTVTQIFQAASQRVVPSGKAHGSSSARAAHGVVAAARR